MQFLIPHATIWIFCIAKIAFRPPLLLKIFRGLRPLTPARGAAPGPRWRPCLQIPAGLARASLERLYHMKMARFARQKSNLHNNSACLHKIILSSHGNKLIFGDSQAPTVKSTFFYIAIAKFADAFIEGQKCGPLLVSKGPTL